jgi:hypothetical protein
VSRWENIHKYLPNFVTFTDETEFTRDGIQNFHIQHLWIDENSHAIFTSHHQQRFPINIWAGTYGNYLFGPNVLLNFLQGRIRKLSNMPDFLADVAQIIDQKLSYMHDYTPADFSLVALKYLNRKFPGR